MPGGEQNIKSIFIKSTDAPAVPIYVDTKTNMNDVKVMNNMTPRLIKKNKKLTVKRLKKKAATKAKNSVKKNKKLSAATKKAALAKKNATTTKKIKNLIN